MTRVANIFGSIVTTGAVIVAAAIPAAAGSATIDWLAPDGTPVVRTVVDLPGQEVTQAHVREMHVAVLRGTLGEVGKQQEMVANRDGAGGNRVVLAPGPEIESLPKGPVVAKVSRGKKGAEGELDWSGARVRVEPLAVENCVITRYEFSGMVRKNNYVEYDFVELMSISAGLARSKKKGDVDLYIYDWTGNLACSSTRRGKYIDDCGALSLDCTNTAAAVLVMGVKKKTRYGLVVYMTTAY